MGPRLTLDDKAELERLRRRVEEQAEIIRAWEEYGRDDKGGHFQRWASSMCLARSPALILSELISVAGEPVSNERLIQVIESERKDQAHEPDKEIVKVHVHRIRDALKRRGFPGAIVTHYGFGYSITPEAAKNLRPQPDQSEADPEFLTAARLVIEKHSIGKLQPAHISDLRSALDRLRRASMAAVSGEGVAA